MPLDLGQSFPPSLVEDRLVRAWAGGDEGQSGLLCALAATGAVAAATGSSLLRRHEDSNPAQQSAIGCERRASPSPSERWCRYAASRSALSSEPSLMTE